MNEEKGKSLASKSMDSLWTTEEVVQVVHIAFRKRLSEVAPQFLAESIQQAREGNNERIVASAPFMKKASDEAKEKTITMIQELMTVIEEDSDFMLVKIQALAIYRGNLVAAASSAAEDFYLFESTKASRAN